MSSRHRGVGMSELASDLNVDGDFLFHLNPDEADSLRMHFASLKKGRGRHRKHGPLVFTEHGAIMAATVLSSPRAVQMSVYVVRAFVKLRQALASNTALARRLETLERSVAALDADTRKQLTKSTKRSSA